MKQVIFNMEENHAFERKGRMKGKEMMLDCTRCSPNHGHNKNPKRDNSWKKTLKNPRQFKRIKTL